MSSNSSKNQSQTLILRIAIASRLILLTLILLWRSLLSPYDTSAPLNPNCLSSHQALNSAPISPSIGSAIESSIVWDGVYFARIAQCGYEYEQTFAFLPLLPILMYSVAHTVLAPLVPVIGYRAVLGLSGYVINNVAFVFAAVYLYRLSAIVLKDRKASLLATILFCFNPASIFYSSVYSESLYSLFSFGGLYYLLSGSSTAAVLLLAVSGSARSNGVLNAGYFCFQAMHRAYDAILRKKHANVHGGYHNVGKMSGRNRMLAVQVLITGVVRAMCIFVPFIAFQLYGYYNLCLGRSPDEIRPWCKARIPFLYDFIQSHYWGVGFLRYFELKQLPNFLLASPILSLALCSIVHYAKLRPELVFSLGFRAPDEEKDAASVLYLLEPVRSANNAQSLEFFSSKVQLEDSTIRQRKHRSKVDSDSLRHSRDEQVTPAKQGYSSILLLPFILHLGFMAATAFFVMHVQVATRFLSSSPPLYWFSSYLMHSRSGSKWGRLVWAYCAAYIFIGSLLFSNFYPFT
ncbi:hypothetical protein Syun_002674 [Stephania yunnanensis]|uniref:GPI mannosyltransferase 2 n=1 Tax=Stephania yunnanensis TaxID=152371 RepID=A0AAP0LK47_9MAGN